MSTNIAAVNNTALSVPTSKAVDVRRGLATNDDVLKALSVADKRILVASTRKPIYEMNDVELSEGVAKTFKFIALDLGYTIKDAEVWQYTLTRITTALKAYYKTLTLSEVSLAFELYTIGELDKYLPTINGEVNKNHYQQLTLMYVSNVLNAYRLRQADAVSKAHDAAPKQDEKPTADFERKSRNYIRSKFIRAFLYYKYHGELKFDGFDDMFYFEVACRLGYAEQIAASDADKKKAYGIYMARAFKGLCNKYEAYLVRKHGADSEQIAHLAYIEARKKEVKRAFVAMAENEVAITEILRYE